MTTTNSDFLECNEDAKREVFKPIATTTVCKITLKITLTKYINICLIWFEINTKLLASFVNEVNTQDFRVYFRKQVSWRISEHFTLLIFQIHFPQEAVKEEARLTKTFGKKSSLAAATYDKNVSSSNASSQYLLCSMVCCQFLMASWVYQDQQVGGGGAMVDRNRINMASNLAFFPSPFLDKEHNVLF